MAVVIPQSERRIGTIDTGSPNIPALDQTLPNAISNFGSALSSIGAKFAARGAAQKQFGAEQQFAQFQNRMGELYNTQANTAMPASGVGFHDSWIKWDAATNKPVGGMAFDESRKFIATLPSDVQPEYQQRLDTWLTGQSEVAATDEFKTTQAWFKNGIVDATNSYATSIRQNGGVNGFDQFRAAGDAFIDKSGLSPADKDVLKRTWHSDAAIAHVQGLAGTDPQAALDELNNWIKPKPAPTLSVVPSGPSGPVAAAGGVPEVTGTVSSRTVGKIIAIEGTGNNPTSSAFGVGQFIDSTWLNTVKQYRPDIAAGKTNSEILALKGDRGLATEMTTRFTEQNARALTAAGLTITEGRLYLAHFLGAGGAIKMLSALPGTSAAAVVGTRAVAANQSIMGNKTVDQVIAWAERKMGNTSPAVLAAMGGSPSVPGNDNGPGQPSGGASYSLADLSPQQIDTLTNNVQSQINDIRVASDRIAALGRDDIAKSLDDMAANHPGSPTYDPQKPTLTADVVAANRENLSEGDYNRFLKALDPGDQAIHTDPKTMLQMDDLAQSDPVAAIQQARDMFTNNQITRGYYDQVTGIAEGVIAGNEKRPWVKDLRQYLSDELSRQNSGFGGSTPTQDLRALSTKFAFDDWAAKNPEANRDQAQAFAKDLLAHNKEYLAVEAGKDLPIPRFANVTDRRAITPQVLERAAKATMEAFRRGGINEADGAEQTRILQQWTSAYGLVGLIK